ncbi:sulfotransferase [Altererythrobacter sp. GH1-8]|uniref:tetratricopeptide repeat-containing sulfotransferase family protein n=1 Tax=Altererythrobacter sp. GH1-8 TaxID=3349333 RepID=UPI00374D828F
MTEGGLKDDPRAALRDIQAALRRDRGNMDLLHQAAAAHRALGERPQAEQAEIAALQISETIPALREAARQMAAREFGEASRLAAEYLRNRPDDLAAITLSAEAAIALSVSHQAIPLLERVLSRAPSFMRARVLYANALMLSDRLTEAMRIIAPMIERRPDDVELVNLFSRIKTELGDHAGAAEANRTLVKLDPKSPEAHANLGDALRFAGQKEASIASYRMALTLDPNHGRTWWSLADLDAKLLSDEDLAQIQKALEARKDDPEHAGNLHFALGLIFDKRGEHDAAFTHFAAGNRMRKDAQPYDPQELTDKVTRFLDAMTPDRIPALAHATSDKPTPIFVLGMPRAGSTLVERMLGRHSQIEALGELSIAPHMVERIKRDAGEDKLAETIANLSDQALANMGEWYIARAREHMKTDASWFVDKLHMNWRHLPLILRMLPHARIIDIRRDAMDCCWSNTKVLFARGHPAASDLTDIARFYRDYVRQTDTLRERAPGRIYLQNYEALVDDIETQARAMFQAMQISFEPQVIDFHLSQDPVATASSEQVRKPLNRKGIGTWKPYAKHLTPLRDALGEFAENPA